MVKKKPPESSQSGLHSEAAIMEQEKQTAVARQNWKKLFAVRKFLSLSRFQSKQSPAELVVGDQYIVGKKIANGAFGQLRLGLTKDSDAEVAIKLEPSNSKFPMLFLEFRFYKTLGHGAGFPRVYYFGTCGKYNALVMDLLSYNLEELFTAQMRNFSLKTILLIAIQLINRVEYVHSKNIIYRDIKPENCLIGLGSKSNVIHMVDFGLAKLYVDPETGRHIDYSENKNLTGTVRYMSINAHQGKEQSRRDDLEALGYVFYYFLSRGNLPWQGVKCDSNKKRYQIIRYIKEATRISYLNQNHPWEFAVYMRYCRNLKFTQCPDYGYLKYLFYGCLKRHHLQEDYLFDWCCDTGRSPAQPKVVEPSSPSQAGSGKSICQPTKEADQAGDAPEASDASEGIVYLNPQTVARFKVTKSLPGSLQRQPTTQFEELLKTDNPCSPTNEHRTQKSVSRRMFSLSITEEPKVNSATLSPIVSLKSENDALKTSDPSQTTKPSSEGSCCDESCRLPEQTNGKSLMPICIPASMGQLLVDGLSMPSQTTATSDTSKSDLLNKRPFWKATTGGKGIEMVEMNFPICCPLFKPFKRAL